MNMDRLCYLLHSCLAQAEWHFEQYEKFNYYAKYYRQLQQQYINIPEERTSGNRHCDKNFVHDDVIADDVMTSEFTDTLSTTQERKKKKKKKRKKRKTFSDKVESNNESEEFEIDAGFKEFLQKSAEFRKQRDAEKAMKQRQIDDGDGDSMECVEYVDVLRKGPEGTILPPTASNRKQMYDEKYGEKGTTILSLETALQWKYNKFMDSKVTSPWPAIPLRFT